MPERLPPPQPEQSPTPQQLNAELNMLYERLPREDVLDVIWRLEREGEVADDSNADYVVRMKRRNSEYGQIMQKRVSSLVGKAAITPYYKTLVLGKFTLAIEGGFDPDDPHSLQHWLKNHFLFFLDRDNSDGGGIFDPKRAVVLERVELEEGRKNVVFFQERMARDTSKEEAERAHKSDWEALAEWEAQINEHYEKIASV
jgi:hypothetical protein